MTEKHLPLLSLMWKIKIMAMVGIFAFTALRIG
nr:MAG TPA: hypothetical protein [Caudoviricetes sp.]